MKEGRLRQITVSAGHWDEIDWGDFYGRTMYFGSAGSSNGRDIVNAGVNWGLCIDRIGPVRVVLEFKLGVEHVVGGPASGLQALAGTGLELATWIGAKWQVAINVDRDFATHSGNRNQVGIALRWSPKALRDYTASSNNRLKLTACGTLTPGRERRRSHAAA